jgi:formamidopyrimidine-DNA glycosylase
VPELPEVETMRRGIAALVGARITAVRFPRGPCRPLAITPPPTAIERRITGAPITAIERYGKRLALAIGPQRDDGRGTPAWLVIEPRMTGLMLLVDPPTTDHVRMEIDCRGAGATRRLRFWDQRGLGTIRLVDAAGLARACGPDVLGPDGLVITAAEFHGRLRTSRRAVKVALLDQRVVAGIGNIYAAEILHRAGIDPRTPCRRLSMRAWEEVAAATRKILATAVRLEGSSIGDELYRTADNRTGRYQRLHRVYGRAGEPCHRCSGTIERIVQAQRSTFFCPVCQPRRGWPHGGRPRGGPGRGLRQSGTTRRRAPPAVAP